MGKKNVSYLSDIQLMGHSIYNDGPRQTFHVYFKQLLKLSLLEMGICASGLTVLVKGFRLLYTIITPIY